MPAGVEEPAVRMLTQPLREHRREAGERSSPERHASRDVLASEVRNREGHELFRPAATVTLRAEQARLRDEVEGRASIQRELGLLLSSDLASAGRAHEGDATARGALRLRAARLAPDVYDLVLRARVDAVEALALASGALSVPPSREGDVARVRHRDESGGVALAPSDLRFGLEAGGALHLDLATLLLGLRLVLSRASLAIRLGEPGDV